MDVFERRRHEKALEEKVKSGKSKGATIYRGGKPVKKLGSHKDKNITQEVKTDGTVVTTTKDLGTGKSKRKVYTPPKVKTSTSQTERDKKLLEEAKTKMLRPKIVDTRTGEVIDKGNFKLDRDFERRYQDYLRRNAQQRKRIIESARQSLMASGTPSDIANIYTDEQLLKVAASKKVSSPTTIKGKLQIIDNRTDLNALQKERAKRELLGMNQKNLGKSLEKLGEQRQREKKLVEALTIADRKRLEQANANLRKGFWRVLGSPVQYGIDSSARANVKGESVIKVFAEDISRVINRKNIKNSPQTALKITKGFGKEIGDIINFVVGIKGITIDSRGNSYDGLIATPARKAINYGMSLARRAEEGGTPESIIKQDLTRFAMATGKVSGATINAANFVRKEPELTSLIIGAAIYKGVISSKKEFLSNPAENTGRAIAWLFPGKIIQTGVRGVQVTGQTLKKIPKTLNSLIKITKDKRIPIKQRKNIVYSFMIDKPTYKDLVKQYTRETFLKLKMNKINSIVRKANKIKPFKAGSTIQRGKDIIIKKITDIIDIPKTQLAKLNQKRLTTILNKAQKAKNKPIRFKAGSTKEQLIDRINKLSGIPKEILRNFKMKRINAIAKSISAETTRFKAGPRRKKVLSGKKAQIRPLMQQVQNIEDKTKQNINKAFKLQKNDVVRFKIGEEIQEVTKLQNRSKNVLSKLQSLNKTSLVIKRINRLTKLIGSMNILKQYFRSIDTLKIRGNIKGIDMKKIRDQLKDSLKELDKAKAQDTKKVQDKAVKKIQDTLKDTLKDVRKAQKPKPKSKLKKVTKPKKSKKLRLPRLKIKLPSIENIPNNQIAQYKILFRERRNRNKPYNPRTNPVVKKTISMKTTKNRALAKAGKLADNRTVRSIEVKLSGVTNAKKKDIKKPTVLKKFTKRKGKDKQVLKFVEKTKYISDKPGEKRELKVSRARAKQSKPKKKTPSKRVSKSVSNKKTFKTKKSAEKNLKKGQSVYKVKDGWRRTSL